VARDLETTMENVRNLSWAELIAQPASQTFDASSPLVPLFGKAINPLASTSSIYQGTLENPVGTIAIETVASLPSLRKVSIMIKRGSPTTGGNIQSSLVTYVAENGVDRK
jgi:hypothetical protein